MGLGRPSGAAARDHVPAPLGAAQHLRLRLLGPSDGRGPDRGDGPPAGPAAAVCRRRAAGSRAPVTPGPAAAAAEPAPTGASLPAVCAPPPAGSWLSTASCTATNDSPAGSSPAPSSAGPLCSGPSSGSSGARRPTASGEASSRPSSTRSSPCTCRATPRPSGDPAPPWRASTTSPSTTTGAGGSRPASRLCGTPPWPWSRSPTPASIPNIRPSRAAARWLLARGDHGRGRLGGAPARAGARRLGVRVRQRQLPRHRRHRRGGAGPAPGRHRPPARTGDAACAGAWPGRSGMQSRDGGWGAFDADNDSPLVAALPFCDFGEVTDPPSADVTAHVIEMLAEEPDVPTDVLANEASPGCRRSRSRRVLVRAMGRQLRVRDRCRRAGPDRPPA